MHNIEYAYGQVAETVFGHAASISMSVSFLTADWPDFDMPSCSMQLHIPNVPLPDVLCAVALHYTRQAKAYQLHEMISTALSPCKATCTCRKPFQDLALAWI